MITYTVRRPITDDPRQRREGAVVTRHRSLVAAQRSLDRQRLGARRQGGFIQDYIWDEVADREVS